MTLKPVEVEPAWTVVLDGTVAAEVFELDSVTTAPPVGAVALSVAVPATTVPASAVVGFTARDDRTGAGVTVSTAVLVVPL